MSGALGCCVWIGTAASARLCALTARCAFSQSGQSVCFMFEGANTLPQLAHFTFSLLMWRAPRGVGLRKPSLAIGAQKSIGVTHAQVNVVAGRSPACARASYNEAD